MIGIAARIAAAAGDAAALLTLAIELAQENAQLTERADLIDARRSRDADRKRRVRGNPQTSTDHAGHSRGGADIADPLSPRPSLLPPTPPNNPSFPPFPASSSAAAGDDRDASEAEQRLAERLSITESGVVRRFLARAGSLTRRAAWVGRLSALMDTVPHFTPAELGEGLEALMTEPEESWKPSVLKAWVRRVRTDADRLATGQSADRSAPLVLAEAATLWARYKSHDLLTPWPLAEYERIGGALVAAGCYPTLDAFLAELRITEPWTLRDARTDGYAINETAKRLQARRAA